MSKMYFPIAINYSNSFLLLTLIFEIFRSKIKEQRKFLNIKLFLKFKPLKRTFLFIYSIYKIQRDDSSTIGSLIIIAKIRYI